MILVPLHSLSFHEPGKHRCGDTFCLSVTSSRCILLYMKKNCFKNKINKNEILKKHMVRDTLYMCLELKGPGTFWDTVVSPIPTPSRPQKGTRSSRPLPRALPCHPPGSTEAWVRTVGTCSQAADDHLFQDSEWARHSGVLHGWICGIPRFLSG